MSSVNRRLSSRQLHDIPTFISDTQTRPNSGTEKYVLPALLHSFRYGVPWNKVITYLRSDTRLLEGLAIIINLTISRRDLPSRIRETHC